MKELIDRLRENRITPEELEQLRHFFETATDDEIAGCFPETVDTGAESSRVTDLMVSRMKEHIDSATGAYIQPISLYRRYRNIAVAAAVVIPLLITALVAVLAVRPGGSAEGIYALSTGAGESTTLSLPDGTTVVVNENTMLSTSGFSVDDRNISFDGEAYFNVSCDPHHPFTIRSGGMTVEVYGTSFNLLSRSDSNYAQLSLDSGSVRLTVDGSDETVDMIAGQSMLYDRSSGRVTLGEIGQATSSSWRTGEMLFDQAPPGYVIERIEKTYGICLDTSITNSIDRNFTGMLPSDNLDEAMMIIKNIY